MWVELELRVGGDGLSFAEMRLHGGLDGALCGRGRRSVWVQMAWCVGSDGTVFSWKWHGSWVEMVRFVGVEMEWCVVADGIAKGGSIEVSWFMERNRAVCGQI